MDQLPEARFILDADGDLAHLAGRTIAVVGYGNLGRSFALNMRDSGLDSIIVGELAGPAKVQALADGFRVEAAGRAASEADIVFLLVPDELASNIYSDELSPALRRGCSLVFASGFNLAFGRIKPDQSLDVMLLAPRMIGAGVRELYEKGKGFPSFLSLEQDATGQGWPVLCALAKAIGSLRVGAIEISAAHEAYLDLFVEQTVGPDLADAILTAFQVGIEAGLPPEALVLELYMSGEMGRSFQAMADLGFFKQVKLHGFAAAFGGMIRFMSLERESRQRNYEQVLREIREGSFADALDCEAQTGFQSNALLTEMLEGDNPINKAEQRLRDALRLNDAAGYGI